MKWLFRLAVLAGLGVAVIRWLGYDLTVGGLVFDNDGLKRLHERGYRRPRMVLGGCVVSNNIDVSLMTQVVPGFVVCGGFVGPKALAEAYGNRLRVIGGATLRDAS